MKVRRAAAAVIAVLVLGLAGWGATTRGGASAPEAGAVSVGSERVTRAAIEIAAKKLAGGRPRRLAAARRTAADRAIERLWLRGEAARLRLSSDAGADADLAELRGTVADALAASQPRGDPRGFARAFDRFHARLRSRTRCEPAYHDPYADRCGNL